MLLEDVEADNDEKASPEDNLVERGFVVLLKALSAGLLLSFFCVGAVCPFINDAPNGEDAAVDIGGKAPAGEDFEKEFSGATEDTEGNPAVLNVVLDEVFSVCSFCSFFEKALNGEGAADDMGGNVAPSFFEKASNGEGTAAGFRPKVLPDIGLVEKIFFVSTAPLEIFSAGLL